jgi:hypothetical protein
MRTVGNGKAAWREVAPLWVAIAFCAIWACSPGAAAGEKPAGGAPPPPPPPPTPTPTFTKDVAPILQRRCQNCHRRHQIGPFSLETYEQARKRSTDIAAVAGDRSMPPWKPARGVGPKLKHDQSLTAAEIATLEAWADAGAPQGDPKLMPPPVDFSDGWRLGPPDVILEPAEEFAFAADAPDTYRCFVVPTNLAQDTYICAIDLRPGSTRAVHHINAFLDVTGCARKRDKAEPGAGYMSFSGPGIPAYDDLTFWAGGHVPSRLPAGIGQLLPAQCDIILQIHYHATGKPEVDRTRVGLYFSREPVKQALHWTTASNSNFILPAGESKIEVKSTWYIPTDVQVVAVSPHMHQLGSDMQISADSPGGKSQDLIHIPKWDPSWQSAYYFQKPVDLPRGSVVRVVAHFDNSTHPRNPNSPPEDVTFGFDADDEMCEGFIAVVKKGQDLTRPRAVDDLPQILQRQNMRRLIKRRARPSSFHTIGRR